MLIARYVLGGGADVEVVPSGKTIAGRKIWAGETRVQTWGHCWMTAENKVEKPNRHLHDPDRKIEKTIYSTSSKAEIPLSMNVGHKENR